MVREALLEEVCEEFSHSADLSGVVGVLSGSKVVNVSIRESDGTVTLFPALIWERSILLILPPAVIHNFGFNTTPSPAGSVDMLRGASSVCISVVSIP